jgi:hypothetical protein
MAHLFKSSWVIGLMLAALTATVRAGNAERASAAIAAAEFDVSAGGVRLRAR